MYRRENRSTNEQPRRVRQVVVVESSQQIKVDLIVVEYIGIGADEPNEVDEIKESPPDGKGAFKVVVGCEVDLEVDDDEDDGGDDEDDCGEPEAQEKGRADGFDGGDFDQVAQLADCPGGRDVVALRVVELDLSAQAGYLYL